MQRFIRCAVGLTLGVGALALSACTVSDASDQKAANDSAAAAQSATQGAPSPTTGATGAAGAAASTPGAATGTTPGVPGANTAATSDSGAAPSGTLSPDSVDVGRRARLEALPLSSMRLEVDLAARQLHVYDGDARVATHSVAVGSTEWPTQTGQWYVQQVIWNPEWNPPDESWAEQRTAKKPGAPDNPLGRAQLVYDPPRTIHGTNEPASIGKAVSHGSIRLRNATVQALGRQLMEATGAGKDDAWYERVQQNRTEKVVVDLPQRVPIRVF